MSRSDVDPIAALDRAVARWRAYERDEETRGPETLEENQLAIDVENALDQLSSPAHGELAREVRSRLQGSFEPDDEYAVLPGQWATVLVKMIGVEALPDLLDACSRPGLVDGAHLQTQLSDLVLRHPAQAARVLTDAAKPEQPLREMAIAALTYLEPKEGPASAALLDALRDPSPTIRAHAATFIAGSDWSRVPTLGEELSRVERQR